MSVFKRYKYGHQYKLVLIACYLFFAMTMAIKLTYTAQLVEIVSYYNTTKAMASLGLTIYYFSYTISQIVLGLIISKIDIKKFLVVCAILSSISFSLIGITTDLWQVCLILALNGIFQCGGWGGINYIIGKNLPNDTLPHCSEMLATSAVVGISLSYLLSAVCIQFFSWKITFVLMGALYLISTLFLLLQEIKVEKINKRNDEFVFESKEKESSSSEFVIPSGLKLNIPLIMGGMLILSLLGNCLYYGVGNWIPSYLKEVHAFPVSLSILITLVMPLASVPPRILTFKWFDKNGKIFPKTSIIGIVLTVALILMVFFYGLNLLFAILASLFLRCAVEAYLSCTTSYTLMKFKNYVNTGTSTLIANSAASLGAGIIAVASGAIMDALGWANYYLFLAILSGIYCVLCLVFNVIIKKKIKIDKWL